MIRNIRAILIVAILAGIVAVNVQAQAPFSAQIQAALRVLRAQANSWTGTQTFAGQVVSVQSVVPTCSLNCGTSPAVVGGDVAGIVTMGASGVPASGWVVTFRGTWAAAPSCEVSMALAGMVVGKLALTVATSTTTMTVVTNGTAPSNSDKYSYICLGVQ